MPIFECEWEWIDIDFVVFLPNIIGMFYSISVVVDRLNKRSHIIPIRIDQHFVQLSKIYVNKIVRLHGIHPSIISERVTFSLPHFGGRFMINWAHTYIFVQLSIS